MRDLFENGKKPEVSVIIPVRSLKILLLETDLLN